MTLSRTARILIALLLLSAAAFFWVNFFQREPGPVQAVPAPVAPVEAAAQGAPTVAPEGGDAGPASASQPDATGDGSPSVVVPSTPEVATRDLVVSDLPFLVTEPPAQTNDATGGAANANAASRPQNAQRMSVNPFSPILVQAPPAAPQASAPAQSAPPQVVQVETPSQPAAVSGTGAPAAAQQSVRAPAPRPIAPPSTQTAALPRQLPSGTLSSTPDILRTARTQPRETAPTGLGRLAAVREPEAAPLDGGLAAAQGVTEGAPSSVPVPMGPAQTVVAEAGTQPAGGSVAAPLQAGTSPLSRYLRDHNVRFTGTVLGPVSVGVFRSALYTTPVVLSLGQNLPDTHIVLTDLRGHEASFTMDDSTQTISLDLRR